MDWLILELKSTISPENWLQVSVLTLRNFTKQAVERSSFTLIKVEDPLSPLRFTLFAHVLYLNGKHQLILGRPLLSQYNPQID